MWGGTSQSMILKRHLGGTLKLVSPNEVATLSSYPPWKQHKNMRQEQLLSLEHLQVVSPQIAPKNGQDQNLCLAIGSLEPSSDNVGFSAARVHQSTVWRSSCWKTVLGCLKRSTAAKRSNVITVGKDNTIVALHGFQERLPFVILTRQLVLQFWYWSASCERSLAFSTESNDGAMNGKNMQELTTCYQLG